MRAETYIAQIVASQRPVPHVGRLGTTLQGPAPHVGCVVSTAATGTTRRQSGSHFGATGTTRRQSLSYFAATGTTQAAVRVALRSDRYHTAAVSEESAPSMKYVDSGDCTSG